MNKKNEDNKNVIFISHSGEFLIWLIVILFFVALSSLGLIFKEKNDTNDYQIFLQDVDGLIVGSPVRMMGIEVGHVVKIKPTKDEVYVKFILTNPQVHVPQGTVVTVEFAGLAGSKSLELYPPDKTSYIDKTTPLITVESPKRLHDAMGLLYDMFKKFGSIIYTTSSFGSKIKSNDLAPSDFNKSNANIQDFIKYSNDFLDNSEVKLTDMKKNLGGGFKNDK